MPSTKETPRQKRERLEAAHARTVAGDGPRPKYETGPTDEDTHDASATGAPEADLLMNEYVPGSANRTEA